jgi:hypothetical protein
MSEEYAQSLHRGIGGGMYTRKAHAGTDRCIAPLRVGDHDPEIEFALDSPLEEAGFELSVPREARSAHRSHLSAS